MSFDVFELPTQINEAMRALQELGTVVFFVKSRTANEREQMRLRIRQQICELLAVYAGVERDEVRINNMRGVAPSLSLSAKDYALSIAHGVDVSCAALSLDANVGVDIVDLYELDGADDLQRTAAIFFSPQAVASLRVLDPHRLKLAFAHEWARLEAGLKLLGRPMAEWHEDSQLVLGQLQLNSIEIRSTWVIALALSNSSSKIN